MIQKLMSILLRKFPIWGQEKLVFGMLSVCLHVVCAVFYRPKQVDWFDQIWFTIKEFLLSTFFGSSHIVKNSKFWFFLTILIKFAKRLRTPPPPKEKLPIKNDFPKDKNKPWPRTFKLDFINTIGTGVAFIYVLKE